MLNVLREICVGLDILPFYIFSELVKFNSFVLLFIRDHTVQQMVSFLSHRGHHQHYEMLKITSFTLHSSALRATVELNVGVCVHVFVCMYWYEVNFV